MNILLLFITRNGIKKRFNDNPKLTIALCGHDGDWEPDTNKWQTIEWTRNRGYSTKENGNRFLERIWISNSKKLTVEEESLFEERE